MGLSSEKDGHDGFRGGQGWVLAALTSGECEGMARLGYRERRVEVSGGVNY